MSCTYSNGGRIVIGIDGHDKVWGDVSRCDSCGSLVAPEDRGIHDAQHERLDLLAAMVTGPLIVEGKITLNEARKVAGIGEADNGESLRQLTHRMMAL